MPTINTQYLKLALGKFLREVIKGIDKRLLGLEEQLEIWEEGIHQVRSWWPRVKLMSVLWKMAAHWKGAPFACVSLIRNPNLRKD